MELEWDYQNPGCPEYHSTFKEISWHCGNLVSYVFQLYWIIAWHKKLERQVRIQVGFVTLTYLQMHLGEV